MIKCPGISQVLEDKLAFQSFKFRFFGYPVCIVEILVECGNFSSIFLSKILGAVIDHKLICIITIIIPEQFCICRKFKHKFPEISHIYHGKIEGSFAVHIAVVEFHFPGTLGRRHMGSGRGKSESSYSSPVSLLAGIKIHNIVIGIVIPATSHKGQDHILTHRRFKVPFAIRIASSSYKVIRA